ncbi:origin recognition complex, subunit 6 [Xylaria flabelliformis]|nr:origin recognition complex, subunit 6 [Xylaria flabelliformis]
MSRTLEPTLYSLLPSYATALPQPLLELASSLLAQSRHSAGALKVDEEVARSYACAHIACERLKISLDLPPIQVRPPIPPRLYRRLYTHLDNVLASTSLTRPGCVQTPISKAKGADLFGSAKATSLAKYRSPATTRGDGTPTKSASKPPPLPAKKKKAGGLNSTLPAWLRPTIQLLCKELDQELIGRTVLAGMQTIVAPHGRRTKDEWVNDHLAPLLAAVYCLVAGQLYVLVQGKDLDNKQYSKIRKSILDVLEQAQEKVAVPGMDEDELWIGWSDVTSKDVDKAMAEIIKRGWQKDEWFDGFEGMVKRSESDAKTSRDQVDMEDEESRTSEKLHIHRADTMFQSRWDMTDQKRREYREWENGIMQRIEEIEQLQPSSTEVGPA